jgi:hypothetical protein
LEEGLNVALRRLDQGLPEDPLSVRVAQNSTHHEHEVGHFRSQVADED